MMFMLLTKVSDIITRVYLHPIFVETSVQMYTQVCNAFGNGNQDMMFMLLTKVSVIIN